MAPPSVRNKHKESAVELFDLATLRWVLVRNDTSVALVGCEAGGEGPEGMNSATLTLGKPGVLHGTRTYLLQVSHKESRSDNSLMRPKPLPLSLL